MLSKKTLPFAALVLTTGCTGFSLGEKNPGADTYLEFGDVAVDDRTEKAFLLHTTFEQVEGSSETNPQYEEDASRLVSIDPDSGAVTQVADLTGRADARILFPSSGILVMSEQDGKDELLLVDHQTFEEKKRSKANARYHGTRMSASRDWVAVADNTATKAPIHILDTQLLTPRIIPHDGDWLEAMWKNKTDELFAIVFYDADPKNVEKPIPHARILSWSMEDVAAGQFKPSADGFWPDRKLDIGVPHVAGDGWFSFTWVGISPDDKWAVFPVRETDPATPEEHALLVVETATGKMRTVLGAKGPVGFTPDGSTIVSYDDKGSQNGPEGKTPDGEIDQRLLLIDVETLEVDPQDVDISGSLSYFISRDGNFVVVASNYGEEKLVLYDVDNGTATKMDGPAAGLDEFVSRKGKNELWMLDGYDLLKLDMNKGTLDEIPTGYSIASLNILPKHDWLVMSEQGSEKVSSPRVHFFDLASQKDVKAVDIE